MAVDANVRTYDPKLIVCTLGIITVTGYADGTFLTIARSGNIFEKRKGAAGDVDRTNKNANDFAVTLTLMQTSLTNDALSALALLDSLTNTGKKPLTVKDLNGSTLFFAPQAWIAKDPDDEEGDASGNREWALETGIGEKFTGGNIL